MFEHVLPASILQSTNPEAFDPQTSNNNTLNALQTKSNNDDSASKAAIAVHTREIRPLLPMNVSHIKSSPYDDRLNFLDLSGLSTPVRLFALALTEFDALRPDYATSAYMETFNFDVIFKTLRELCEDAELGWKRQEFYVVIFRSKLRVGADRTRLGELDQMSHQEVL